MSQKKRNKNGSIPMSISSFKPESVCPGIIRCLHMSSQEEQEENEPSVNVLIHAEFPGGNCELLV